MLHWSSVCCSLCSSPINILHNHPICQQTSRVCVQIADEAAVGDGEVDDEEEGMGMRQSSGLGHMGEGAEDGDLGRGRKRRGLKNARPTGKARRRRLDEEDEQMEEVRIAKRRKRGASSHTVRSCLVWPDNTCQAILS